MLTDEGATTPKTQQDELGWGEPEELYSKGEEQAPIGRQAR